MNSLTSNRKPICHFLLSLTCSSSKFIKVSLFSTSSSPPRSPSSYSSSRRIDEESRNVKVSVWWDVENCSIPTGINAFRIAQSITAAVRVNGIKGPVQISAFGDIFCISRPNQEALSSTGINLIHVPHGGKNSADRSLLIDLMCWASQNPPPAHIFLISSDRDFANILYRLRMNNYNILLAAREGNHIGVLCGAASIMWQWNELVKGENLSGRHFNQPPDGPYNSWYGHYRGPLEDPFDVPQQQNFSRAKNVSSSNADSLSDKVQPIPKSLLKQIRQIIHSYPYGVSITELRAQMAKNNVTLDKNFYGHKKFSCFLLSMPHIVKVVSSADGQLFLRPVSPKVPEPVESDDNSAGPTTANGSSDIMVTRERKGGDQSITRMVDVEPRLPSSSTNVMKEKAVDQVASTKVDYAKETRDSQVVANSVSPTRKQDPKSEMALFRRLWRKWFTGSIKVEKTTAVIHDKFDATNVIHGTTPSEEGLSTIRQHETFGTSYLSSTVNAESNISGKSDVGLGIVARVLSWFISSKNQTSVSTPTEQFSEKPSSIDDLRKHDDALQKSKHEDASQENMHEEASPESKHEDVPHSRMHELFSKETFWNAFESFLRTHQGFDIVLNAASREQFAKRLKNDGPLVLRSLQKSDLLQLIDLLVSEKKWIEEFPSRTPRFRIYLLPEKSSTPVQASNSNGLSSLSVSSSSENPQLGIFSVMPKKAPEKSRSEMLSDCQNLLDELLQKHPKGLNMGPLKRQFLEKYGYNLDYQKLGYPKLVSLLQIMPGVKIESGIIFPDKVVYAPSIESLGSKEKSLSSDSEMIDSRLKNEEIQCPWEELGPVENSNLSKQEEESSLRTVDMEYEPSVSEEDEFSEEEHDESSAGTNAKEQSRSTVMEEYSSLLQIVNTWCSPDDEGDQRDHDPTTNAEGLVNCSKEETWSSEPSSVGFKGKQRAHYTFVADFMDDDKGKHIDGFLGNMKKSSGLRMQS